MPNVIYTTFQSLKRFQTSHLTSSTVIDMSGFGNTPYIFFGKNPILTRNVQNILELKNMYRKRSLIVFLDIQWSNNSQSFIHWSMSLPLIRIYLVLSLFRNIYHFIIIYYYFILSYRDLFVLGTNLVHSNVNDKILALTSEISDKYSKPWDKHFMNWRRRKKLNNGNIKKQY